MKYNTKNSLMISNQFGSNDYLVEIKIEMLRIGKRSHLPKQAFSIFSDSLETVFSQLKCKHPDTKTKQKK